MLSLVFKNVLLKVEFPYISLRILLFTEKFIIKKIYSAKIKTKIIFQFFAIALVMYEIVIKYVIDH